MHHCNADHGKHEIDGQIWFAPCDPDDLDAIPMTCREVPQGKMKEPQPFAILGRKIAVHTSTSPDIPPKTPLTIIRFHAQACSPETFAFSLGLCMNLLLPQHPPTSRVNAIPTLSETETPIGMYFIAAQVNAGEDNDPSSCGSWT